MSGMQVLATMGLADDTQTFETRTARLYCDYGWETLNYVIVWLADGSVTEWNTGAAHSLYTFCDLEGVLEYEAEMAELAAE